MAHYPPMRAGRHTLVFDRTLIMGILNVTPDSFSDGGLYSDVDSAVARAKEMVDEGADIIDVGGESSRPGSDPVSTGEELARVLPVIEKLASILDVPVSIDTYKPEVAEKCVRAGASIINDIFGLRQEGMIEVASSLGVPVVIMHMKGTPKNMQLNPEYSNVVEDVFLFLKEQSVKARRAGIQGIIVDPGIGFGKSLEHNLLLIKNLKVLSRLGPVLLGPSRKSFIGQLTGLDVSERLEGTLAAVAAGILNGASIIRVHDVKACRRAAIIADAIKNA